MIYKKLNWPERSIALLTSLLIFLFYLLFNFNYLSNWIDEKGDVRTYDYYVRLGIPENSFTVEKDSYRYLINPHHIAFDWVGQIFYISLLKKGYDGSSMVVLQLRNLLVSALGLAIIFFLFFKISKRYLLSLLIISVIAFCCAFWIYSQINDTPIIHSIMLCILFLAALYFPQAKNRWLYSVFLGFFHAINIFFHQSDALMLFVILFIILFAGYLHRKNGENIKELDFQYKKRDIAGLELNIDFGNIRYFLVYLLTFTLVVGLAYYYVGIVVIGLTFDKSKAESFNRIKDSTYFFNWLILYTKIDYWGKGFENDNTFWQAVRGISNYFYQPRTFGDTQVGINIKNFFQAAAILPNLIAALFISVFGSVVIFFKQLYRKYSYVFIANLLFLIIYTAFSCWWEPDYREFWVAPMFSFWTLTFLVYNYLLDRLKVLRPLPQITLYSFLTLLTILLFYFNFTGFIHPNASSNFKKFEIIKNESSRLP